MNGGGGANGLSPIKGRNSFTLAEVLITLGIIGIVAAPTLPGLIQRHKKTVIETELKKSYSLLNQLLQRSEADNGSAIHWEWPGTTTDTTIPNAFFNKYFAPYLKITKKVPSYSSKPPYTPYSAAGEPHRWLYSNNHLSDWVHLSDGSVIMLTTGALGFWHVIFPHSAKKDKIILGRDAFSFSINITDNKASVSIMPSSYRYKTCENVENNRALFLEYCRNIDMTGAGIDPSTYCTMLIYCNDWKIPEDYPIKL